jgi:hypothetical protein
MTDQDPRTPPGEGSLVEGTLGPPTSASPLTIPSRAPQLINTCKNHIGPIASLSPSPSTPFFSTPDSRSLSVSSPSDRSSSAAIARSSSTSDSVRPKESTGCSVPSSLHWDVPRRRPLPVLRPLGPISFPTALDPPTPTTFPLPNTTLRNSHSFFLASLVEAHMSSTLSCAASYWSAGTGGGTGSA